MKKKSQQKQSFVSEGDDIICDAPAAQPGPRHHPCCPYYRPVAPKPKED
jgi:hypothetical protein